MIKSINSTLYRNVFLKLTERGVIVSESKNYRGALAKLAVCFFMFAFVTNGTDALFPKVKELFTLNYTETMLLQFVFFGTYGLTSVFLSKIVKNVGYKKAIVSAFVLFAIASVCPIIGEKLHVFSIILLGQFIFALGCTFMQLSSNPFAVSISGTSGINLLQGFNSIGAALAPAIMGYFLLRVGSTEAAYSIVCVISIILALYYSRSNLDVVQKEVQETTNSNSSSTSANVKDSVFNYPHMWFAAFAIFVYVGVEVSIGTLMVNFAGLPTVGNLAPADAIHFATYYMLFAMCGRFIGAYIFHKNLISGNKMIAINAIFAIILTVAAVSIHGMVAVWAMALIGLCNSIMFPTIFALGTANLNSHKSFGEGLLIAGIIGGAIIPFIPAYIGDHYGLHSAFFVNAVWYAYILFFGLFGYKSVKRLSRSEEVSAS